MKLVFCFECSDIFSPGVEEPKKCACGYSLGQWVDSAAGTLEVASRFNEHALAVLGINNEWLSVAVTLAADDELHKHWNEVTSQRAEGYLFKTRNCPIVMVRSPFRYGIRYAPELLEKVKWYGKYSDGPAESTIAGEFTVTINSEGRGQNEQGTSSA